MKGWTFTMAPGWQVNKLNDEMRNQARQTDDTFHALPAFDYRRQVSPFLRFVSRMSGRYFRVTFRTSDILAVVGIGFVWAADYLFSKKLHTTLIPFTGDFVTDSLILTAVIGVIWFFAHLWQKSYDNMAAEIESKYTDHNQH